MNRSDGGFTPKVELRWANPDSPGMQPGISPDMDQRNFERLPGFSGQIGRSVMKILLQDLRSGMFCKAVHEWTKDRNEALEFMTSDDAIAFARKHGLHEARIIAQFQNNDCQIQIPYKFDILAEA